jgi:hypothetical protein
MRPIDVVLSLLPSLGERERQMVIEALNVVPHPCQRAGHRYVKGGIVPGGVFTAPRQTFVCQRCGASIKA